MQRIDENTYVDDSLVTCAEYQLFIDEMREQGKYYQPDHWTSYQFSEGQAWEPILGVRQSSTMAFCKWLSERNGGEWYYRLPQLEEVAEFSILPLAKSPYGYWTIGNTETTKFSWIGSTPINAHDLTDDLIQALNNNKGFVNDGVFKRDKGLENIILLICALHLASEYIPHRNTVLDFSQTLESAYGQASVLARDFARSVALTPIPKVPVGLRIPERVKYQSLRSSRTQDIDIAFAKVLVRAETRDHDIANDFVKANIHNRLLDLDITKNYVLSLDSDLKAIQDIEISRVAIYRVKALQIFIDLFTLQERIAGRSPAFEGIRLVKERR